MDALQQALPWSREMYEEIDPDEEGPDEQGCASSSSPTMEPSQPSQLHSVGHSHPLDAIESIREMYQKIDPPDQIDPLLCFVETWLHRMNNPSEAGSSSSEGWLETVREGTKLAAEKTIHTISTEAEKPSIPDAVEEMGNLVLKVVKGIEESHLVFIGLSIAAFALESYMRVRSVDNECRKLLLEILELAQKVKHYEEQMHDTEKLRNAVGIIVECGVICCDYLTRGGTFRFWSTTTATAQLEKAKQQLGDIRDSIQFIKDYGGDKDVFLSHSGKQKNFVRQLHRDLAREHVSCFFDEDDKSLPLAERFAPLIFKHAETCKIAVLVLSKDFILSRWPMLELSAFIRAKNSGKNVNLKLLPIFFMTSSKELRNTQDSPEWQQLKESNDKRGEWEAALKEVCSIKGLTFAEDGNEVACRDKIVEKILCILRRIYLESRPQLPDFEPVGIDKQRNEVTKLLALTEPSRRVVVIYGVGGIGKTTLATAVFKSLDLTGYHYCRVDMDQDCKLSDLQKQILLNLRERNLELDNCTQGREELGEAFRKASKPVFLFIDNALRQTDLEKLLPINHISRLPMQSRILVTTRNLKETNIFRYQQDIQVHPYIVDSVSKSEAKRILCHYAVGDMNGNFDRGIDVDGLLQICSGIPLVLRIVGFHLRSKMLDGEGNAVTAYNDTLQYFKEWQQEGFEGGEEDVSESIVGFVYERLKEPCKQAFLDIAFFFTDWDRGDRSKVADIVGKDNLHDLEVAALVTTSEEKDKWNVRKTVVKMHDIVRARGKKLAKGTRITDIESLSVLLSDAQKLQQIKGVWPRDNYIELSLEAKHVDLMSNSLRVLFLGKRMRVNGRCERAFEQLRCLHISSEHMLLLHLRKASRLIFFRVDFSKGSHTMPELPESLRVLHLYGEMDYPVLLDSNGHFISVRELKLSHITLHSFGNMSCLQTLDMRGCSQLQELPESFGNMSCLQELDMSSCSQLQGLPESFGNMSCLQTLNMSNCSELQGLPQTFDQLSCLQTLEIDGCNRMRGFSVNFGKLKGLKFLNISNCKELNKLPEDIVCLTSLAAIKANRCASLEAKAMDSLVEITSLKLLEIDDSPMLIKRWEEIIQRHPPIGRPLRLTRHSIEGDSVRSPYSLGYSLTRSD